ncbi:hypothetical protein E7W35_06235, partial [Cronobacter sakazakii]|nr:hypothetical protein [Cronobacter sakazakii]
CCSEVSISPLFRWPNSVNHFSGWGRLTMMCLCWSSRSLPRWRPRLSTSCRMEGCRHSHRGTMNLS